MKTYNTEPVKQTLDTAQTILILLPQEPSLDMVAAGLSLYLSLIKQSKTVSIGCATAMTVGFNRLYGIDKVKTQVGNQNLIISFDYLNSNLEKISHDTGPDGKFFLTIEPKAGVQPVDTRAVSYSYTGSSADLIFVIGARQLEDLGVLFHQEKTLLQNPQNTIINLSHLDRNSQFGRVNLYDPQASGCSEITYQLLMDLGLTLEPDIATNLLAGIEEATNNLSQANSADTFEIIAQLLRAGAKKGHLVSSPARPSFDPSLSRAPKPTFKPVSPLPTNPNLPPQPSESSVSPATQSTPSPDWLKPKVYKSTTFS